MSTDLPSVSKSHNEGTTQPLSVFSMWSGGQVVRWSGGQVVRRSGDQVARWPMVPGHRPSDKWPMATGHPTLARNQFAHLVGLWRRQETCTFTICSFWMLCFLKDLDLTFPILSSTVRTASLKDLGFDRSNGSTSTSSACRKTRSLCFVFSGHYL